MNIYNIIMRIIFLLSNIFDITNGVSTKYIKFIEYLINKKDIEIILMLPILPENNNKYKKENIKIINVKGINLVYYKQIKIPIIHYKQLSKEIKTKKEIIIFNGEFLWFYKMLNKIKKVYPNVRIYPNMHTDYSYYINDVYFRYLKIDITTSLFKLLNYYLKIKIFDGIIVTGENLKNIFLEVTNKVFNANEIDLSIFKFTKIDDYKDNFINFIYCGRIAKEKNIDEIIEYLSEINYEFKLHIIGDGPYLNELKNNIDNKFLNIKNNIIYIGILKHNELYNYYLNLVNRIFIFTSISETFGKTPMEAGACGIPIFIKKSLTTKYLYKNKINAFIFKDKDDFKNILSYFLNITYDQKKIIINNSLLNIQKYDQNYIFEDWIKFLKKSKNNTRLIKDIKYYFYYFISFIISRLFFIFLAIKKLIKFLYKN